jgi:hypothetical protein
MNRLNVLILTIGTLFASGCEVETPDGKVPAKFITQAQEKTGVYVGNFEDRPARFELRISSEGLASLSFSNSVGDIVGATCNSRVGQMNAIWGSDSKVGGASFNLSTQCVILGKQVDLDFDRNGKAQLRVLKSSHVSRRRTCSPSRRVCRPNGGCTTTPGHCSWESVTHYNYLQGNFFRAN